MAEFHLDPQTIDYEALPPLVPKGVDPEAVLGPLVEAWATPLLDADSGNQNSSPGVTLDRVALVDGNTGEPINLGEIVARVGQRAIGGALPDGFVPGLVVSLRGCSIPMAHAQGCTLRCHLVTTACRFGTIDFREAVFGGDAQFVRCSVGDARFDGASFDGDARFGGAAFDGDARFDDVSFRRNAGFRRASFVGTARFSKVRFGGVARFRRASFEGVALFGGANFDGDARFSGACFSDFAGFGGTSFGGVARFGGATFGGVTRFGGATFGGAALFGGATFGDHARFDTASFFNVAQFDVASFGGDGTFVRTSFGGHAEFVNASFSGRACFRRATFGGDARFSRASFSGFAHFDQASFGAGAWFGGARFDGTVRFRGASFGGAVSFQVNNFARRPVFVHAILSDQHGFGTSAAFATAIFQSDSRNMASFGRPVPARRALYKEGWWRRPSGWFVQGLHRARWRAWSRGDVHRLRWDVVRGFGELAILTRVSMSALVLVPILAALWPAVRLVVEWINGSGFKSHSNTDWILPEVMPWIWAFLFFAAVLVVLGRVLYQAFAPQEVREASRVDFIARHADAFREASDVEREQLLREAIEAVDEAGSDAVLCWFRHCRLVRHHGRVVWIPGRIEDFEYEPTELPTPEQVAPAEVAQHEDQENDQHDSAEQVGEKPKPRYTAEPVMPAESRKMIAVRAGADARYDLIARQNRQWARFALWCYTLAVVLVVVVLWDQSVAVLRETGMARPSDALRWALPALAMSALVTIALWIVWDAWMGWLRWPWLVRQWERLKKARGSFTPIDEMQAEIQRRLRDAGPSE